MLTYTYIIKYYVHICGAVEKGNSFMVHQVVEVRWPNFASQQIRVILEFYKSVLYTILFKSVSECILLLRGIHIN